MTAFPLNIDNNIIHLRDSFYSALTNSSRFNEKLFNTFSEAYSVSLKTILEGNNIAKDLPELEQIVRSRINNIFNLRFRKEDFVSTLSDTVASYSALAKNTGFGQVLQNFSILWANWNNNFIEPARDTFWRTPSYKVAELEKYSLFRYKSTNPTSATTTGAKTSNSVPLLIVYAFINRHYILDLVPEVSIVRSLLKQGFDNYATDWGTPSAYDKECQKVLFFVMAIPLFVIQALLLPQSLLSKQIRGKLLEVTMKVRGHIK